jgi:transposase
MMYSGIDLHSNNSVVAVIDDGDRVVAQKRLPNDIGKITGFLARWQDELAGVVVESTYNWYWLVDGLQDAGLHVHLANTAAIKQYEGLKHSGDETDAQHLAHLLRLGILPTGTILPREHRVVRDLARKRMQLVQSCTTHVLAVENIMARQLGGRMTSNQIKRLTDDTIDSLPMAADVGLAIKANVAVIATLQSQIEVLEKRLQERVRPRTQYALLTTVPGIGQTLATVIVLETARSIGSPRSATLRPMRAASTACIPAIARRKAKATSRTATNISPGHSSRRRILPGAFAPRPSVSMSARRPRPTTSSPPRRWRTSWRAPATIS